MRNEDGGVTLVMAALIVITMLVTAGVVRLGATAAARARAQAAADATALAAAGSGRPAAESVAAANDAEILAYEDRGDEVTVTIRRGAHEASARARWEPATAPGGAPNGDGVPGSRTLADRGHEATR